MVAIYYVKYLKEILGGLGVLKRQLADRAEVAEGTLSNAISRNAISKVMQSRIRRGLDAYAQELEKRSLEDFISATLTDEGRPLTIADVFQEATIRAPGFAPEIVARGGTLKMLAEAPYSLHADQLTAISDGACFTPYIEAKLRSCYSDQKLGEPSEGVFQTVRADAVTVIVSESKRRT